MATRQRIHEFVTPQRRGLIALPPSVRRHLHLDEPGAQVEFIELADGRITRGPTLVNPQSSSVYRAAADGALRALRQTAPFDVPQGFPGGAYRPTFNTERACRNR